MTPTESHTREPVPPERLAEASVWIARLHGGQRGRALEDGLRRWLAENPDNARAFEAATEVWDEAVGLRRYAPFHYRPQPRVRWRPVLASAFSCLVLLVIGAVVWMQYWGAISTAVGEQRQVTLDDGTRVFLNTDTRLIVKYDEKTRRVELRRGEALFNVAKRANWPFVVVVGDRQVRALGTSFVVRKDAEKVAVTLMEGSVLVTPGPSAKKEKDAAPAIIAAPEANGQAPTVPSVVDDEIREFKLTAGQRLTFSSNAPIQIDRPSVERTTAWRRGQVILDDTPLEVAAAEMNRYNETKLVIQDPDAAALLVNGLFQAGDSIHFANAVADTYGLTVTQRGNQIVISGKPVQ